MADDLFHTANVKVRRGQKHIASITSELSATAAEHDNRLRAYSAADIGLTMEGGLMVEFPIPPRHLDEIACCVGDAVHNLRSALDLLACQVVEKSGGNPDSVHFPFAKTAADLTTGGRSKKGMIGDKHFDRARPDAQQALLALAPHGEPNGNRLLWGLHRLDLVDKHQDLLVLSTATTKPNLYIQGVRLDVRDDPLPSLTFAPGSLFAGEEVVAVLDSLAGEAERTIQTFSNLGW